MTTTSPDAVEDPLIELRGIHKSYVEGSVERPVLIDADLSIREGQIVALVGRSGSGKSTLLNLVSALDLPNRGTIRVSGQSLGDLDETGRARLRREKIGFIFQFFNLIPTLTVRENVLLPLELGGGIGEAGPRATALLERMGLEDRFASFPDVLSGGEQQRVAIARSLVHRPSMILADEPTGNLDQDTAQKVLDLLISSARADGTTLLIATHSRDVAARADRIIQLQEGRFVDLPSSNPA